MPLLPLLPLLPLPPPLPLLPLRLLPLRARSGRGRPCSVRDGSGSVYEMAWKPYVYAIQLGSAGERRFADGLFDPEQRCAAQPPGV